MAAKRKRNAPETIIMRAVNPAEPPKRSRAGNPRSRAANPPKEIEAQIARAERLSAKGRRLLDYDPRDLSKAEQRKRHADADKLVAEIYEIVYDLKSAGYPEEARALTGNPRTGNPRASRTFFLWVDTSGDESGVGEHVSGSFAPLSGAKTAAKRIAKKTGNDVVVYEVGDGHAVARVYPSGKIDDFESNPRAKAATSTSADNAHVAVQHFITHHKVPTGKFGPWGLLPNEEQRGNRTPKYAYGVARVPTQVIEELDRQGIVFGSEDADTVLGDELVLTIINEGSLYPMRQSIEVNMAKMMKAGKYDPTKAVVGWRHWVDRGAKEYSKEYPEVKFDVPTRDYAARRVAREFEQEHAVQSSRKGNPSKGKPVIKYFYRGQVERMDKGSREYEWHDGYSASGQPPLGGVLYPWMTKTEARRDAAAQDSRAEFVDGRGQQGNPRKANCECQHQNARAKRLRKMDEY